LFSFCSKRDYSNTKKQEEEKQEVLGQETPKQEMQIPDALMFLTSIHFCF